MISYILLFSLKGLDAVGVLIFFFFSLYFIKYLACIKYKCDIFQA